MPVIHRVAHLVVVALALATAGAIGVRAEAADLDSGDELWDVLVRDGRYRPVLSDPIWVVPSARLPSVAVDVSNNNLSVALHDDRLYLAWRTAPSHFASARARLQVISSPDMGQSWVKETEIALGRDLREPFLLSIGGRLRLYFAELGANPLAFEPGALWRTEREAPGRWAAPVKWGEPGEMAWDFKVRRGRAWVTSYGGKHYRVTPGQIAARFRSSSDGVNWTDVGRANVPVYRGGVSEISFEFEPSGRLWAVTRNEDGDGSGFGSHVVTAPPEAPGAWQFPARSAPERYDSPRLFRHGRDLYLVARRDLGPPIGTRWERVPDLFRKLFIWQTYWLRPKRTTLYRLDTEARRIVPLLDLPSAGDTAFPSVARLGPDDFLIANYTSDLSQADETWLSGQLRPTKIYFVLLRFVPDGPRRLSPPAALPVVLSASRP
jgi:hypothetical protein